MNNTFVGANTAVNAGEAGAGSMTSYTLIGSGAGGNGTNISGSNVTCLGYAAVPSADSASNEVVLGDNNIATLRCQVSSISSLSDERDKTDIEDATVGLDFVNALQPRFFTWKIRDVEEGSPYIDKKDMGFIAQELDEVQTQFDVAEQTDLVSKNNPDKLETRNARLIPVLVKAIKELSAKVEELEG